MHHRRKRLFDHVVLHVRDIDRSKKFYRAVIETLGHTITDEGAERFFVDELEIRENSVTSSAVHLAFQAENPGSVKLFHETALRFGGKCLGGPATTDTSCFTAQVTDPDGNRIQAVFKAQSQKGPSISY